MLLQDEARQVSHPSYPTCKVKYVLLIEYCVSVKLSLSQTAVVNIILDRKISVLEILCMRSYKTRGNRYGMSATKEWNSLPENIRLATAVDS